MFITAISSGQSVNCLKPLKKNKIQFGAQEAKAYVYKWYTEKVQPHDSEVVQSSGPSWA